MPKPGFSLDDLLHPKPREYQVSYPGERLHRCHPYRQIGRKAAIKIRRELGLEIPPIDLEPACKYLAVSIVEVDRNPGQPNAVGRHKGYGLIEIVRGLPRRLYRTTLAHELGHEVLRHSLRSAWDTCESLLDQGDPHEAEAWDFAGELLMPYEILKQNRNKPLEELEALFDISRTAIIVQLSRRNLL